MTEIIINEKGGLGLDLSNYCETHYILAICEILKEKLEDYSIVVTTDKRNTPKTQNEKKIIILLSDENLGTWTTIRDFPLYCGMYPVFRQFNTNPNIFDNQRVFPIPLGYNSTGYKMKQMYPEKPISERQYDFVYTGQYHGNRAQLLNQLMKIKKDFNCIVNVTKGFREGYEIDEYYKLMGNSKISFAVVNESFRYYESMCSGCITMTVDTIDRWYYEDSPVIKLKSWNDMTTEFLKNILSRDLNSYQEKIKKYNQEKISTEAVSNYIIKKTQEYYDRKNIRKI
jgi:hypothetical protein